jgi:hypothetical protein
MSTRAKLKELSQHSLELRTALQGAMQFKNAAAEKEILYKLSANNALVVDAVVDYLARLEYLEQVQDPYPQRVIPAGDTDVKVTKHTPINLSGPGGIGTK